MNDFTIEELRILLAALGHLLERIPDDEPVVSLRNTLEAMLKNYPKAPEPCTEHDWEFVDHGSAGYYKCLKCNEEQE